MSEATDPEEMSVIRGMEGGFLSVAQPSGFFFVGVGPVRGTSFPFELAGAARRDGGEEDSSTTTILPPLLAPAASASSIESEPTMDRWSSARREAKP